MKQQIIFNIEEGDNPQYYIDPIKNLTVIRDITEYLRHLQKYGNDFRDIDDTIDKIREKITFIILDAGIDEEWIA